MEIFLVTAASFPWQKIIAFVIIGLLYFVAFYKEKSLLTKAEQKKEKNLGNLLNHRLSGRTIWAIIGLFFTGVSFLLSFLFY
ncbi:hypothetical protein [Aquimarina rhabdastrellae]